MFVIVRRHPLEAVGLVIAVLVIAVAILGPFIAPFDPTDLDFANQLSPPSTEHPFGTDDKGRDILSRVLFGARLTLSSVAAVIAFALVIGLLIGVTAALRGGWLDEVLMRTTDIGLAMPSLVLALGIAAALGSGLWAAVVALALTWWPGYARLIRSLVLDASSRDHVDAARVLGMSRWRLVRRHVLPATNETILVQMAIDVAAVALVISGLSFVGVGVQPPEPEWGAMIAEGRGYFQRAPWVVLFPGLAIVLTAVSFNLVGDLIRTRSRERRGQAQP
jgi:peptide/nickel transport system permease protein